MAQIKEAVSQVMGEISQKTQNMDTSQKQSSKCVVCGKEWEYTLEENEIRDKRFGIYSPRTLCSQRCWEKKEQQRREKNINSLMAQAGIPPKFIGLITDKDITPYIASDKGVYLWGKVGTGKTVMACSIGRQLIIEGKKVQFISSPKFIVELQSAYRKEGQAIDDMLNEVAKIPVLIIDDIGAEKLTDFVRQTFYYLINEREQWMLKTIITSNYSLDEIDEYIDKRISSRIAGMCDVVELTGKDKRVR